MNNKSIMIVVIIIALAIASTLYASTNSSSIYASESLNGSNNSLCIAASIDVNISGIFYDKILLLASNAGSINQTELAETVNLIRLAEISLNESKCIDAVKYSSAAVHYEEVIFRSIVLSNSRLKDELACMASSGRIHAYLDYSHMVGLILHNSSLISASNSLSLGLLLNPCNSTLINESNKIYNKTQSIVASKYNSSINALTTRLINLYLHNDSSPNAINAIRILIHTKYVSTVINAVNGTLHIYLDQLRSILSSYISEGNITGIASMDSKLRPVNNIVLHLNEAGINLSSAESSLNYLNQSINYAIMVVSNTNKSQLESVEYELRLVANSYRLNDLNEIVTNLTSQLDSANEYFINDTMALSAIKNRLIISTNIIGVPMPNSISRKLSHLYNLTISNLTLANYYLNQCRSSVQNITIIKASLVKGNSSLIPFSYYVWIARIYCPLSIKLLINARNIMNYIAYIFNTSNSSSKPPTNTTIIMPNP
ncbi:MAG: hypothetical protein RXO22_07705 [Thermocladium sp.]